MPYHDNGPRAGRNRGRFRNTLLNNASKAPVPPPLVSPSSATAYGGQLATLQSTLAARLAALRAQKGLIQGQFRMERAAVRSEQVAGMASAVNQALERGIVGSSIDAAQRIGVEAQAATGISAAIQARVQGLLGLRASRIEAANEYYTGIYDVQARKAAEQAELATQALMNDLVMRLGDETVSTANAPAATPLVGQTPGVTQPVGRTPEQEAQLKWLDRLLSRRI